MRNSPLYDADFYSWALEQAAMLRSGAFADADVAHIVEELESMGARERRELESRLRVLLLHRLQWRYQPSRRGVSWRLSIENAVDALDTHLRHNPGLKSHTTESLREAYRQARREAAIETGLGLETFPVECPWSFEAAMHEAFEP